MTALDYRPQTGSGTDRVLQWFKINREEQLTASDLAAKFDIPKSSVYAILERALAHGYIAQRRDEGLMVYVAGDKFDRYLAGTTAAPASAAAAAAPWGTAAAPKPASAPRPSRRGMTQLPPLRVEDVQITTEPIPPAYVNGKGANRYAHLFVKLEHPGMCFKASRTYRGALAKAAESYAKHHPEPKPKYVVRMVDPDTCGVWRTA